VKVVYVCGYGRSGSTLLGSMLSERLAAVHVGESTHVASADYLAAATCACGRSYDECSYWSQVDTALAGTRPKSGAGGLRRRAVLEGAPGLLVPMVVLRRLMPRLAFSERYPGVGYAEGVRAMCAAAGGTVVDGSKTTRLTANRPRLLAAAGAEVTLFLVRRPLRGVVASHVAAGGRRGIRRSSTRSLVTVLLGRAESGLAARFCALTLRTPLPVVRLEDSLRELEASGPAERDLPRDHAIAGNRRRHGSDAGGSA
jgi:hypothetical protein